ncbi:MAG: DUF5691 domain-containing protein [Saprospiraceae bacterium]
MWQKLTTTALLGLGRSALPEDLRFALLSQGIDPDASPEKALLDGAAMLLRQRQAHSILPAKEQATPPDLSAERLCSPAAGKALEKILDGTYRLALPEFLKLTAAQNLHLPPAQLPMLLELAVWNPEIRTLLEPVAGPRSAWLIALNPRWGVPARKTAKNTPPMRMSDEAFNAAGLEFLAQHRELENGQAVATLLSTPGYVWSNELVLSMVANFAAWLERHPAAAAWAMQHYRSMLEAAAYGCEVATCKAFETEWVAPALDVEYFRRVIAFRKEMVGAFE